MIYLRDMWIDTNLKNVIFVENELGKIVRISDRE